MAIDIDCYSPNFTAEAHTFINPLTHRHVCGPKLLPITRTQRTAAHAVLEAYPVQLHEETCQLCVTVNDTFVYIDAQLRDEPNLVHFKVAIARKLTQNVAHFVFDFVTAGQFVVGIPEIDVLVVVPKTPTDHLPTDWRTAQLCDSPRQMQELLDAEWQANRRKLQRLKNQWH